MDAKPCAGPDGWTKVNIEQRDDAVKFGVVHRMRAPDTVSHAGVVTMSLDVTTRREVSPDGRTLTRAVTRSNYPAVFRQPVQGRVKETPLAVKVGVDSSKNSESRDTYVLPETKR